MIIRLIGTLGVLVGIAIAPTSAFAAAPATRPTTDATGIIAILIGQVHAQPFTPPIGTDKGSFASNG